MTYKDLSPDFIKEFNRIIDSYLSFPEFMVFSDFVMTVSSLDIELRPYCVAYYNSNDWISTLI